MNTQFSLSNPHTCHHCCGSAYLKILEMAAGSITTANAINMIATQLELLALTRREYSARKLAELFSSLTPSSKLGDPISQQEKAGTSPDFSPHPTHRSWAASSSAEALDEGTPSHLCGMESQRSCIQKNASGRGL